MLARTPIPLGGPVSTETERGPPPPGTACSQQGEKQKCGPLQAAGSAGQGTGRGRAGFCPQPGFPSLHGAVRQQLLGPTGPPGASRADHQKAARARARAGPGSGRSLAPTRHTSGGRGLTRPPRWSNLVKATNPRNCDFHSSSKTRKESGIQQWRFEEGRHKRPRLGAPKAAASQRGRKTRGCLHGPLSCLQTSQKPFQAPIYEPSALWPRQSPTGPQLHMPLGHGSLTGLPCGPSSWTAPREGCMAPACSWEPRGRQSLRTLLAHPQVLGDASPSRGAPGEWGEAPTL